MSTSARYTYLQLPSSHHIRLLEFPGYTDQNEPLQGTLRVVDIEEPTVPYVALSYTWGQPNFSEDLFLDGKGTFGITPTLAAALRRFRYASALRWIWVDAICINQQDDEEKTMQIPLMEKIYRGASRVMVWLGDQAQDSDLLRQIKRLVGRVTDPHEDDAIATRLATGMSQLGGLPWFSRRWIVQELVLNPNAVLCCGQTELPWPHLAPAFQVIDDKKTADLQNIRLLWDLWRDVSMPTGMLNKQVDREVLGKRDTAALMNSCSAFECLDGHDRIAALLGLATDARGSVAVKYADPVEQTFLTFAEGLARSGHLAWLIYQSCQRKTRLKDQGRTLPSWVPDWRAPISIHDQNSKLDTEVYKKSPCDIQMYSAIPRLHLLTAKFSTLVEKATAPDNSSQVPVDIKPAPLQVAWKSVLLPKEADLAERMALVLMDLWPWVVAHLSEHEQACSLDIWLEVLIWLSFSMAYPRQNSESRRGIWVDSSKIQGLYLNIGLDYYDKDNYDANGKRRVIPDFGQDANGIDKLRSFTRGWVKDLYIYDGNDEKRVKEDLTRIDCLILCRQTSQSGTFTRGLPFAIGSLQFPFYHAVEIGDRILSADLGHFQFFYSDDTSAQHDCRHIVREHAVVDGLPALSAITGSDSIQAANECASQDRLSELSKKHGSEKFAAPVVHEFVAPCDLIGLFSWRGLKRKSRGRDPTQNVYHPDKIINSGGEILSILIK